MNKSRIAALVLIAISNIAVAVNAIPKDVVEPRQLGEQLMKFAVAPDPRHTRVPMRAVATG